MARSGLLTTAKLEAARVELLASGGDKRVLLYDGDGLIFRSKRKRDGTIGSSWIYRYQAFATRIRCADCRHTYVVPDHRPDGEPAPKRGPCPKCNSANTTRRRVQDRMGLGAYPAIGLAEARKLREANIFVAQGLDPRKERDRRRVEHLLQPLPAPTFSEVIERIGAIYASEAEIRGRSAQQRLEARQLRSRPLMDALKTRLTKVVDQFSSQSPLTEAINYMLNHWNGLTLFLTDGRVEVDSNTIERSMRPIALERNSLLAGSEGGAESWAILSSLVTTTKLNELDPQTYLTDVLERIVSGQTKSHQLHELLAWNWKAARERTERAAA